jgi:lysine/arginine/ornithine transport system substrate-binding protein
VILTDVKDFAGMNAVYKRYFPTDRLPARTTFAGTQLVVPGAKVEVECIAVTAR